MRQFAEETSEWSAYQQRYDYQSRRLRGDRKLLSIAFEPEKATEDSIKSIVVKIYRIVYYRIQLLAEIFNLSAPERFGHSSNFRHESIPQRLLSDEDRAQINNSNVKQFKTPSKTSRSIDRIPFTSRIAFPRHFQWMSEINQ